MAVLERRLVELHGGRVWLESELGKGGTFTFALPVPHRIETALGRQAPALPL